MNTWIAIPTGQRTNQVVEVANAWKQLGFNVAIYTWDETTRDAFLTSKYWFWKKPSVHYLAHGKQSKFSTLQNMMAETIPEWDVWITGADDLWPVSTKQEIEAAAMAAPDKMIWCKDGCMNKQPTHPIITRGWWESHSRTIFNESYRHNFVDTDLFIRCALDDSVVKCFDLAFDHRHPLANKAKMDSVYRQGQAQYRLDETHFNMKWGDTIKNGLPQIQTMRLEKQ
ncbi:MAG: hypothetical protein DRP56_10675 [Planctomycetota bacterium]|nr:MAG: hypothetical protein DRP56_10675 [Planctomycetota bacterium]